MPPVKDIDDPRYVKAMSHPLRVRIVAMLRERKATPAQLAQWLQTSLGNVAYHVRMLEQLGLIELVEKTQVRGAVSHHYRATEQPMLSDHAWGNAPPVAKQAAVGSALQVIHEYAMASSAAGGFDRSEAQLTRTDIRLDCKGWQQVSRAVGRLLADLQRIEEGVAKRLERHPHQGEPTNASVVLMAFDAIRLTGDGAGVESGDHARTHAPSAHH